MSAELCRFKEEEERQISSGTLTTLSIPKVRVEALENNYIKSLLVPEFVSLEALKMYCVMRVSASSASIPTL